MKNIFLLSIFVLLSYACSTAQQNGSQGEVVYAPRFAQRFQITQRGDSLFLQVKDPWQGAKGVSMEFFFDGKAQRMICMSSSHTAFLDAIGESDKVVGVSGKEFLFEDTHKDKADIGYEQSLGYEKIVGLKSDIMTVYDVDGEGSGMIAKLKQLGVNVIQIADYLEQSPLGRAEWIVAFGAMVGKKEEAKILFDSIVINYQNVKKSQLAHKVKVMLNSPYRDVWYMPGDSSYFTQLITDAGGEYLGAGVAETQSRPISVESAYKMLLEADVWLNPSAHIRTLKDLKQENSRFKDVKASVFSNIKRSSIAGGSDFWESGVVRPDVILKDLQQIFKYNEKVCGDSLFYFMKLE